MGGDALSSLNFSSEEEELPLEQSDLPNFLVQPSATTASFRGVSFPKGKNGNAEGVVFESYGDNLAQQVSVKAPDFVYETRRRTQVYRKILDCYDKPSKIEHLEVAKANILSYHPGSWIGYGSGMKLSDYDVPNTTTLLLVGPKGSGKSSLVNRISRVLDDDKFACDRAQISHNYSAGGGTYFLQEYMIPRGASSFCLYDTRSLSEDSSENMAMLKRWMTKGVRHGELVIRDFDSSSLKTLMKHKARNSGGLNSETRTVNFVIFIVDGLSILRSMEEGDNAAKSYNEMVVTTFNYPFLSFRDDKPVVVMTHGDLLSLADRARIRLYLGELLGIPPTTQIFDIPENQDQVTELEVIAMLRYCLEHADRNLRVKEVTQHKVLPVDASTCLLVFVALGLAIVAVYFSRYCTHHERKHRAPIVSTRFDWPSIRHLWLGEEYD